MIKIFGERNCATRALKQLVETNSSSLVYPSVEDEVSPDFRRNNRNLGRAFRYSRGSFIHVSIRKIWERRVDAVFSDATVENSWKHTATYFDDVSRLKGSLVIFCVRNPFSWFSSLYQNPIHIIGHKPDKIRDFVNFDWQVTQRDNLPKSSYFPLRLYFEKLKSYVYLIALLEREGINYKIIYFEDMVINQGQVFSQLRHSLSNPSEQFQEINKSTKNKNKSLSDYQYYYANELWRESLSGVEEALKKQVDPGMLDFFRYSDL